MKQVENEIARLDEKDLSKCVYIIRGQQIMLDFDLGRYYGYETKNFNRQIKRNLIKFPVEFRFKLTKAELENLMRCQNVTSRIWASGNKGGRRYLPYAFTEQGIYMLILSYITGYLTNTLIIFFNKSSDNIFDNGH